MKKMREEKKLFPAQEKSELVLDIIRKHWFSYVPFWFLTVIMLVPLMLGIYFWLGNAVVIPPLWDNIIIIFVSIYLLFIQGLLIFGFVDFYLDVYIITDRRIVDIAQNGLFKRNISELNLRQIQDVNATVVGFAATLLHFGDVKIQTAGDKPNFIFQSIPHPYEISKKILDLHEAYLRRLEKMGNNAYLKPIEKIVQIGQKGSNSNEKEMLDSNIPAQKVEAFDSESKEIGAEKNSEVDTDSESLKKTLTEKWFDEKSEACYSDATCRQKILDGINKHLEEEKMISKKNINNKNKSSKKNKEGELKEGEEVDL